MITDRGKEIFRHLLQFHALPAHSRLLLLLRDQKASDPAAEDGLIPPVEESDHKLTGQESAAVRQALMPLRTTSSHSQSVHTGTLPWAKEVSLKRHLFLGEGELFCKIGVPIHRANKMIKGHRIVLLTIEDDSLRSQTLLDDDSYRYRKWPQTTITFRWNIEGELGYPQQFEGLSTEDAEKLEIIGWWLDVHRQAVSSTLANKPIRRVPYLVGETFLNGLHLLENIKATGLQFQPQVVADSETPGMIVNQQNGDKVLLTVSAHDHSDLTPLYWLGATRQSQLAQASPPVDSLAKLAFLRKQRLSEFDIPVKWLLRWSLWAFLMVMVTGVGRRGADGALLLAEVLAISHYRDLIEVISHLNRLDFVNRCQQVQILPEVDQKIIYEFIVDDFGAWFDHLQRLKPSL